MLVVYQGELPELQDGYMDCLRWLQQGAPARKATREARRTGVALGGLLQWFYMVLPHVSIVSVYLCFFPWVEDDIQDYFLG